MLVETTVKQSSFYKVIVLMGVVFLEGKELSSEAKTHEILKEKTGLSRTLCKVQTDVK